MGFWHEKGCNWGVNFKIQVWVKERLEWEDWEKLLKATERMGHFAPNSGGEAAKHF